MKSPTPFRLSVTETTFRQEFQVDDGRKFSEDELVLLQILYRRLTADFTHAPAANVDAKITTSCIIENQTVSSKRLKDEEFGSGSPSARTINLEYTMRYESKHYDMAHYPKIFRSWIANNFETLLSRMKLLGINADHVNAPISKEFENIVFDRMHLFELDLDLEDVSESTSSSSVPSSAALTALTMGGHVDRRERDSDEMNMSPELRRRNLNMRPDRKSRLSIMTCTESTVNQ